MATIKIKGFTMAVTDMEAMVSFYSSVFGLDFKMESMFGAQLFKCQWDRMDVLFCPADIANNTAVQNRHQFEVLVEDLTQAVKAVVSNQGVLISKITEGKAYLSVGVKDPDNNTIVLKQKL